DACAEPASARDLAHAGARAAPGRRPVRRRASDRRSAHHSGKGARERLRVSLRTTSRGARCGSWTCPAGANARARAWRIRLKGLCTIRSSLSRRQIDVRAILAEHEIEPGIALLRDTAHRPVVGCENQLIACGVHMIALDDRLAQQ